MELFLEATTKVVNVVVVVVVVVVVEEDDDDDENSSKKDETETDFDVKKAWLVEKKLSAIHKD